MPNPSDDSVAAFRAEARRFMADLRRDVRGLDLRGAASIPMMVEDTLRDARRKADSWPNRAQGRRFLVELAGEARSEWMVQTKSDEPVAQFYAALKDRLGDMSRA